MLTVSSLAPGVRVQSLERGLRILALVGDAADGLQLGELSRRMDLGKTTVHNLARTLLATGHLVQRRDPLRYTLGPEVYALAGRQRLHALHRRAEPVLLRLAAEFPDCAVLLAEPTGDAVRVVMRVDPDRPGVVEQPLDRFSPPYANATSLLFLAHLGSEARRAYYARHPLWETAAHRWPDEETLDACLKNIRRLGHAAIEQERGRAFPVAMPVFSAGDELIAALGLAFRSKEKISAETKRRVIERLRLAAASLTLC